MHTNEAGIPDKKSANKMSVREEKDGIPPGRKEPKKKTNVRAKCRDRVGCEGQGSTFADTGKEKGKAYGESEPRGLRGKLAYDSLSPK